VAPTRGDVQVQLGIQAAIRQELAKARAHFTAARLLGATPDPEWEKALREAERKRKQETPSGPHQRTH
jgi:hypothetical protein